MTSVEQTGWLARLEYAIVPSVDVRGERGERALSILANQVDGRTIVTVKGSGDFNVRKDIGDPAKLVERVRRKLTELSEVKITLQGSAPKRQYSYGKPGSRNGGDEARLKPALMGLAEQGWLLFDAVFPGDEDERKGLMNALELFGPDVEDARTIHVAHTLLPKVIPWSAMYLREYDAGAEKTRVNGTTYPVAHDACTAALPDANGAFPSAPCGSLPTCPLHPDRIADHINSDGKVPIAKTVACPRYFLGFRHVLELPPQQVEPPSGGTTLPTASSARRLETTITAAAQPRFASGFHQQLTFAAAHETALTAVCKGPPEIASWQPSTYQRDDVLAALDDSALDLIYFFCHARGGPGYSRLKEPVLEFHPTIGNVGAFVAAQVKANWMHHPLVFMNGCNTAGFSPSTLSPFIRKFVHDCRAAGVIGTEVPVYEELASEVAEKFLASFLAGKPAGETMLRVRRALLHDQNPLGLVYTLYAAAELHIERSPTV